MSPLYALRSPWCRLPFALGSGCFLVLCLLLNIHLGHAQWGEPDVYVIEPLPTGTINWTDNVVRSQDQAASQRGVTQASARQATLQLAIQKARQRLLTALAHIRFDSSTTIGTVLQNHPAGVQGVHTLVQDAPVVETVYSASGEIRSSVQVSLSGRLLAALWPHSASSTSEVLPPASTAHSGIVIDARGLNVQPALLPRIVDDQGQAVYDPTMVDPDVAIPRGYIAYAKTHEHAAAKARIGEQPLIIRARRVLGASRVDVVLLSTDAAQIRDYAGTQALLRRCQILIVM
jgi:hypothetical protein